VGFGTLSVPALVLTNASSFPVPPVFALQQMIFSVFFFLGVLAMGLAFWDTGIKQIAYWLGFR